MFAHTVRSGLPLGNDPVDGAVAFGFPLSCPANHQVVVEEAFSFFTTVLGYLQD